MPASERDAEMASATRQSTPMSSARGIEPGTIAASPVSRKDRARDRSARRRRRECVLGHELPRDAPSARAECGAHGEFALAPAGAGDQQIRHVRAGDEQDRTTTATSSRYSPLRTCSPACVRRSTTRYCEIELRCVCRDQRATCRLERDLQTLRGGARTSGAPRPPYFACRSSCVLPREAHRCPQLGARCRTEPARQLGAARKREAARHDADDGEALAVHLDPSCPRHADPSRTCAAKGRRSARRRVTPLFGVGVGE